MKNGQKSIRSQLIVPIQKAFRKRLIVLEGRRKNENN
jgi:hypothetical protein